MKFRIHEGNSMKRAGRFILYALIIAMLSVVSFAACACGTQAYADSTDSIRMVSDLASAGTATIDVSGNVSLPELVYVNGTKTLKGVGTITGTSTDYIIVVNSGASLTLDGVTVSGGGSSGNGIYVSEDAAFVMKSGSVQSVKGVGVRVLGKASFNGGSISKTGENWLMVDTGASVDAASLDCSDSGAAGIITAEGSSLSLGSGVSLTGSKSNLIYNGGKTEINGTEFGTAEDYAIHNDNELSISNTEFYGSEFLGYLENAETGNCKIENSTMKDSRADFIYNFGKLSLTEVDFGKCTSTAVEGRGSKSEISVCDCTMGEIGKTAFLCKNGKLTIDGLEIEKCGGNGIHARGCEVDGKDITIKECGGIAFLNDFPSDNDEAGVKSFTVDGFKIGHCVNYAIRSNGEYVIKDEEYGNTSINEVNTSATTKEAADSAVAVSGEGDEAADVADDEDDDIITVDSNHADDDDVEQEVKEKDTKSDKPHMTLSNGEVGKSDSYGLYVKGGDVILNNVKFLGTNDTDRAVIQVGYSKTPGGRLTLNDVDITGGKRGINIYSTVIMNSGNIHGNCIGQYVTSTGAGVYNAGSFIMNGGMIYGNACANSGGGVSNAKDAHFDMYGGIITQNSSGGYGGGVTNSGYFNLYNGTISKNISAKGGGGVRNACVAGLYGGVIKENTSAKNGGGLYCSTSDTCVSGVCIRDNRAGLSGGGIYNAGKMTMQGTSSVTGNSVSSNGSGIYNSGTLSVTDGLISGTAASGNGGGIYNLGSLTFDGATVSDCSAKSGGGIYCTSSGSVSIKSGVIQNCSAKKVEDSGGNGGAVYVYGGSLAMTGGTVSGCTATNGGGIGCANSGSIDFSAGSIRNCKANGGYAGGIYISGSTLTMTGGSISGCTTDNYAPRGVYLCNGGSVTISGGVIDCDSSSAVRNGGAGTFIINGDAAVTGKLYSNGDGTVVTIQGGTFNGTFTSKDSTSFVITGGNFKKSAFTKQAELEKFMSFVAPNYYVDVTDPNYYEVKEGSVDAEAMRTSSAGELSYGNFAELVGVSSTGDKITVLKSFKLGNAQVALPAGITVIGGGNTVSLNYYASGFKVDSGTVTVNALNVTQTTSKLNNGAFAASGGTLIIDNCTLTGNPSDTSTSMAGPAVKSTGGNIEISKSTISGFKTSGNGGAVFNATSGVKVLIKDSAIGSCTSGKSGGGIYCSAGTLTVDGSDISNNTAATSGNDIYSGSILKLQGAVNVGVIFIKDGKVITLTDALLSLKEGGKIGVRVSNSKWKGDGTTKVLDKGTGTADNFKNAITLITLLNGTDLKINDSGYLVAEAVRNPDGTPVYGTVDALIKDASDGDIVKLLGDAELSENIKKSVTIDGGKTAEKAANTLTIKTGTTVEENLKLQGINVAGAVTIASGKAITADGTYPVCYNNITVDGEGRIDGRGIHFDGLVTIGNVYLSKEAERDDTIAFDGILADSSVINVTLTTFQDGVNVVAKNDYLTSDNLTKVVLTQNASLAPKDQFMIDASTGKLREPADAEIVGSSPLISGSFSDVLSSASAGDTVKLLRNVSLKSAVDIDKAITINGNSCTITADATNTLNVSGSVVTLENVTVNELTQSGGILNLNGITTTTVNANSGKINMSGKNVIADIKLAKDETIAIAGDFLAGSSVGVTLATDNFVSGYELITKSDGITDKQRYDSLKYFTLSNGDSLKIGPDGKLISKTDNEKINIICWNGNTLEGWKELLKDAVDLVSAGGTLEFVGNSSVGYKTISKNITIIGNGHTLTCATTNADNSPLTISANVTINGLVINKTKSTGKAAITVKKGATLNISSDITVESSSASGAAINTSGTVNMTGGVITGKTSKSGGGIYVTGGGTLNITGGTFSKACSGSSGAAFFVYNGTCNVSGDGTFVKASISRNATNGKIFISGGWFASKVSTNYLADNYEATGVIDSAPDKDAPYTVQLTAPKLGMATRFTAESSMNILNGIENDTDAAEYLSTLTVDQLDELYWYVQNNTDQLVSDKWSSGVRQAQLLGWIDTARMVKGGELYADLPEDKEEYQTYLDKLSAKELAALNSWISANVTGMSEADERALKDQIAATPYEKMQADENYLNELDTDELKELRDYIIANNSEGGETSEEGLAMTDKVDAAVETIAKDNLAELQKAGSVKKPVSNENEEETKLTEEQKAAAAEEAELQAKKDAWAAAQKYISSLSEEELKALGLYIDKLQEEAYKASLDAETAQNVSNATAADETAEQAAKDEAVKAAADAAKLAEDAKKAADAAEVYEDAVAVAKAEKTINKAGFSAEDVFMVLLSKETEAERKAVIKDSYTLENMQELLKVINEYDTSKLTDEERVIFTAVKELVETRIKELTPETKEETTELNPTPTLELLHEEKSIESLPNAS